MVKGGAAAGFSLLQRLGLALLGLVIGVGAALSLAAVAQCAAEVREHEVP